MLLVYIPLGIKIDVFLLRFPIDSEIPPHRDQVQSGRHFHLNIILKKAEVGGEFLCEQNIINLARIKFFYSYLSIHSVTKVISNPRYVLSIGWILK